MNDDVKNGVFFNLPEETYHALPALSASGIKNLLVSPMDFWARSWMNPLRHDEADSEARIVGKAYHKRILEGRDAFYDCYAPTFEAPSGCLKTMDDIRAALDEKGVTYKKSAKKDELVESAVLAGFTVYDELKADYAGDHAGKTFLSAGLIDRIEIAAAMIEKHPHLSKCFTGGFPEVSVIWEQDGVRFKARFDYLKPKAVVDLKSFANQMNKPIDRAVYHAMASGKYHIQAAFYVMAFKAAQTLQRPEGFPDAWLREFTECEEPGFYFVFQQKGVAPLARGYKFPRGMMHGAGIAAIHDAIGRYKTCLERFGTDPWLDIEEIESFEDDQFPVWAAEL